MPGRLSRPNFISFKMVRNREAKTVQNGSSVKISVGLFYGKRPGTRSENKSVRKKLFPEKCESKSMSKRNAGENLYRKKVSFIGGSSTNSCNQAKLRRNVLTSNLKSAVQARAKKTDVFPYNSRSRRLPSTNIVKSENIYSKIYNKNFSSRREKISADLKQNNATYKLYQVTINLVKHKLSSNQLRSLKQKTFPKNDCLKSRRNVVNREKIGIPVLLIPNG